MQPRTRPLAAGALVLVLGALLLPLGTSPAAAIDDPVGFPSITPVTWLEPDGRQVAVTNATSTGTDQATLRVRRDAVDGRPDGEWSTVIDAPAPGLAFENRLAATDDGIVSIVWRPSGCAADAVCDRTFTTYDPITGATASAPAVVEDAPPLRYALDDGSFLIADGSGPLTWRGPDGADRGTSPIAGDAFEAADVDVDGKLLVLGTTATVARMAVGGAVDLTIGVRCLDDESAQEGDEVDAIGAAPDGGFAVACGDFLIVPPSVTRYDAAGAELWTTGNGVQFPSKVTVAPDGRVWVGGLGWGGFHGMAFGARPVVVQAFTEAGEGPWDEAYVRPTVTDDGWDLGGGIVDLRTIGDEVAFADLQACCREADNTYASTVVHGEVLPWRPMPPACRSDVEELATTGVEELAVTFEACVGESHQDTTEFAVAATWAGGSAAAVVPRSGERHPTAVLTGVPAATLVEVTVTPRNALGPSTAAPRVARTIAPFGTVEDFFGQTVQDLWKRYLHGAEAIGTITGLKSGELTPADFLETSATYGEPAATIAPLARIYRAYFQRDADPQGLAFWIGRRRAGWTVQRISQHFSGSSEFLRTYGSLSDQQFVALVYRNVLGREADPGGADHWTRKLQRGTPRGTVMAQFSEGSEFVRTSNPYVRPLVLSVAMLGRPPTTAERDRWALEADPYATIPSEILGTEEYRQRVTG